METVDILVNLESAISMLITNEIDNLRRQLNELNISTHLAFYLKSTFVKYDVDPEYNGDMDKPNDRKALEIARNRIIEVGRVPNINNEYQLRPDIIIHKRRTNENNLLVIEVKKDTHTKNERDYDLIKLEHLTIDYSGNHYNYKLGVAIVFGTGENAGSYDLTFFQDGMPRKYWELI